MKAALLIAPVLTLLASPALAQGLPACVAPLGEQPAVAGVTLTDVPAAPGDLPAIRAVNDASGAHMLIYYDAVSQAAARARAACLGLQLGLLEQETGDDRRDAAWDSVVFTADPAYAPPRGEGHQGRWSVHTRPDGTLDAAAQRMVVGVMPHEQTHDWQGSNGARTPRWFHEGHATWIGLRATAKLDPDVAAARIASHEAALADAEPLRLSAWGGVQVRPEAILRQLSPEDRARQLADPTFSPRGPFTFGPDDMVSDESNTPARYAGAWRIFQGLEDRHGAAAVQAWARDLTASEGRVANDRILSAARDRFGEDLTPLLD